MILRYPIEWLALRPVNWTNALFSLLFANNISHLLIQYFLCANVPSHASYTVHWMVCSTRIDNAKHVGLCIPVCIYKVFDMTFVSVLRCVLCFPIVLRHKVYHFYYIFQKVASKRTHVKEQWQKQKMCWRFLLSMGAFSKRNLLDHNIYFCSFSIDNSWQLV